MARYKQVSVVNMYSWSIVI